MKILALQLKRLGDVVLTTPALDLLARRGQVTLAVMGDAAGLLPAIPAIERAIVFGRGKGWTPWQQVIWGRFDEVIDFTGSDRSALITWLSRARRRVTFTRARSGRFRRLPYHELVESSVRDQHTVDHYTALAGHPEDAAAPRLNVPADALQRARQICGGGDFALIHAGTARPEKYWVAERWGRVIEHLHQQHGLRCVLTGGSDPQERAHLAEIERTTAVPVQNLAGKLDLMELAALASQASLVMSVDTVVVHLAAAFQRPQVALFGPTNPFHWRPRHAAAVVFTAASPGAPLETTTPRMKGAPMEHLSTEPIIRATDALLSAHGQSPKNLA